MTTQTLAPTAAAPSDTGAPAAKPSLGQLQGERLSRRYMFLVWLPVVLLLAGTAALWEFVWYALSSALALNLKILLVLAWGVGTMHVHVSRTYREDAIFREGLHWVRHGAGLGVPNPVAGARAFVTGMIERLNKLGLGHQVYVHGAATEPEFQALEHYFERKQELSQFLVGLMVGLGLLGTFIGLLQTLVATSDLIGTIAAGAGGGGKMEDEFAKVVGGLQKPLTAMGTAFSASMFGLIGSILLGFQMVIVRKAATDFVEVVRREVLSLAEESKVNKEVEITERFLASLLADVLEQHRASQAGLKLVADRIEALVPPVHAGAEATAALAGRSDLQLELLQSAVTTLSVTADATPALARVAQAAEAVLGQQRAATERLDAMLAQVQPQAERLERLHASLARVEALETSLRETNAAGAALAQEVRAQSTSIKRMDATLWNLEQDGLRRALDGDGPRS
jgi:hypothetical protein